MKKLLFFVAALFVTSFAQAQEGIKLGLKGGVNLSNWTGDDADDTESVFGLHVGGFLDYGISDMVSIRPELLYSMKGFKIEENEDDFEITETLRSHYLDVPVLARISTGNPGLFFEVGPTFSFLLSAKATTEGEVDGEDFDESDTVTDAFKKFDIGFAGGIGYQLENGLGLGIRYNQGLSRLDEDGDAKAFNSVIQFSVSYTLSGL